MGTVHFLKKPPVESFEGKSQPAVKHPCQSSTDLNVACWEPVDAARFCGPRPRRLRSSEAVLLHGGHEPALFKGLTRLEYEKLMRLGTSLEYRRNETIFCEDDAVEAIYLVSSGRVKASQVSGSGKEVIFAVHTPGEVIDGFGWFPGRTHSIAARAVEVCQLLCFEVNAFDRIAGEVPALRQNTVAILSDRVRMLQMRLRDMATERVPQRLARLLIEFVHQGPGSEQVDLSCEELAQMAGTTTSTVSRLLCSWAERGIIEPERKMVIVENFHALQQIADGE